MFAIGDLTGQALLKIDTSIEMTIGRNEGSG